MGWTWDAPTIWWGVYSNWWGMYGVRSLPIIKGFNNRCTGQICMVIGVSFCGLHGWIPKIGLVVLWLNPQNGIVPGLGLLGVISLGNREQLWWDFLCSTMFWCSAMSCLLLCVLCLGFLLLLWFLLVFWDFLVCYPKIFIDWCRTLTPNPWSRFNDGFFMSKMVIQGFNQDNSMLHFEREPMWL